MTGALTTIVVPTVGRPSLFVLLDALTAGTRPLDTSVIVVDDRPPAERERKPLTLPDGVRGLASGGRGPAAARNVGWRAAATPWVSFLDDDVVPDQTWYARLVEDLEAAPPRATGSSGRVSVPVPSHRRLTDWERATQGLETATWITADLSYRRSALAAVGGFDERFPRAYREDADLARRVQEVGGRIAQGSRTVQHPVRPADDWVSVRQQAGNADDALMARIHGRGWRERARAPRGRAPLHVLTTAVAGTAIGAAVGRQWGVAGAAGLVWAGLTADFAWRRIAPGPRDPAELRRMTLTSVAIPFAATWHLARGRWIHRGAAPWRGLPDLVLFDRDGTLIHDVPYNGEPELVRPVDGARAALNRLRSTGVKVGLVTNQSGVARGLLTAAQVQAVNDKVATVLGPFDTVQVCRHGPSDGCGCRKPAPGMVKQACSDLGVSPSRCVVIGDIGSDIEAAESAGAVGILVPNAATRSAEVRAASRFYDDVRSAVDGLLAGQW